MVVFTPLAPFSPFFSLLFLVLFLVKKCFLQSTTENEWGSVCAEESIFPQRPSIHRQQGYWIVWVYSYFKHSIFRGNWSKHRIEKPFFMRKRVLLTCICARREQLQHYTWSKIHLLGTLPTLDKPFTTLTTTASLLLVSTTSPAGIGPYFSKNRPFQFTSSGKNLTSIWDAQWAVLKTSQLVYLFPS